MDKYIPKIVNEIAQKPVSEIKRQIKNIKETFRDKQEQKYAMSMMYNALTPSKRKQLVSSFGNTVQIPSTATASAPVPPPSAVPIASTVVTAPTPSTTIAQNYQQQQPITQDYKQLASTITQATQAIAAQQGQGSFGYRKSNVYYVKHGNLFYNKYIERS